MRKRTTFFFALFLLSLQPELNAQTPELPEFGNFDAAEMAMKECSFDKNANAVILIDQGIAAYDDDYQLITQRRIRIKILNEKGIDAGTIKIHYWSKDNFESIASIEGLVFTPGSGITPLSKKSVFVEKINDRVSSKNFAFPNVKAGSIIEYKYQSIMKDYGGLDNWLFQAELPTVRSCYQLQVLPRAEFNYIFTKKREYNAIVNPKGDGIVYFEMDNIPGLRDEPFMDAPADYYQRVDFQLSGYINAFGDKKKVNSSWQQIAFSMYQDNAVGGAGRKKLSIPAELEILVNTQPSNSGKINVIYEYVKENFTWNGYYGKYATDGIGKVWENKTGTAPEINLVLVSLLQTFKLDAKPLFVAERDFGRVNPQHPIIDRFNKTVAYVEADGKTYILDATQKNCPYTVTPYSLLNTLALPIDKKVEELIQIGTNDKAYRSNIEIVLNLEKDGMVKGNCSMASYDYAKEDQVTVLRKDNGKAMIRKLEGSHEGLKIDSIYFKYDKVDSTPLIQKFDINQQYSEDGGFVLFNYNIFTTLNKNPFIAEARFTDINFGYPYDIEVSETINLPPNSKTDDLLKDKTIQAGGNTIVLSRAIIRTGDKLTVNIRFTQDATLIPSTSYYPLKDFYQKMVEMLNEPIVIKLN